MCVLSTWCGRTVGNCSSVPKVAWNAHRSEEYRTFHVALHRLPIGGCPYLARRVLWISELEHS